MYFLGVDLGTTYTAAAIWREGRAETVTLGARAPVVPSVVLPRADGGTLTGEAAVRRAITEPHLVAREFKRRIGDPTPILLGGVPYSAQALMAELLRSVYTEVTRLEGAPPAALCLSHPANWGPYKLDLLRQVPALADVEVPASYCVEPVAAATFYAQQERIPAGAMVAVYDLGGGTFDAALLRKTQGGFEIVGQPGGIELLGGIDFDAAVFQHVARTLDGKLEELDEDDPAVVAAVARLKEECTAAREALSSDTDTTIAVLLPNVTTEVRLTRAELEAMVRPALYDSIEVLRNLLRAADVRPDQLHSVLLVGGSSRMPIVAQLVGAELDRPVAVDAHPKHAVALGAAWLASGRAGAGAPAPGEREHATALLRDAAPPVTPGSTGPATRGVATVPATGGHLAPPVPPPSPAVPSRPESPRPPATVPPRPTSPAPVSSAPASSPPAPAASPLVSRPAPAASPPARPVSVPPPPSAPVSRPTRATPPAPVSPPAPASPRPVSPPPRHTPVPPPPSATPRPSSPVMPSPPPAPTPSKRRRWPLAVAGALAVALVAGGVLYALNRPDRGAPGRVPPSPLPPYAGTLTGHTSDVWGVAYSPDGTLLASASLDLTIRLWDTTTGQPHGEPLTGHTDEPASVAFSPDGTLLASAADDHTIRLWDVATGQPHGEPLTGHTNEVTVAVFKPDDGALLASASDDGTVRLWDVATGQQRGEPIQGTDPRTVAFSPDGRTVAIGGFDGVIRFLDVATWQLSPRAFTDHEGTVRSLAYSPDGTYLASGSDDGTVRLWDVASGQPVGEPLTGHGEPVWGVAFSPDGSVLVSGGVDRTLRLWSVPDGTPLGEPLTGHTRPVRGVAVRPDGRQVASASTDTTVRLWDLDTRPATGD